MDQNQAKRPLHATRLTAEQQETILRHDLHGHSLREIAKLAGCHVRSVQRTLARHYAAVALEHDIEADREHAVAYHREIQRVAWVNVGTQMKKDRSPAPLLAEIGRAQERIERLLCLEAPARLDLTTNGEPFHFTIQIDAAARPENL